MATRAACSTMTCRLAAPSVPPRSRGANLQPHRPAALRVSPARHDRQNAQPGRRRVHPETAMHAAAVDRTEPLPPAQSDGLLTEEQRLQFWSAGFLVIEDFASKEELEAMKSRMDKLTAEFEPENISIFSTTKQAEVTDQYFYDSAGNVSFFFEEKAFDEDGKLTKPKNLAINKVGHALHDLDPVFRAFSRSDKMKALASSLGFRRPLPVQSMYIFKDSSFLYTSPPSCIGIWLAIEDATLENGCLWAIEGEHGEGVSRRMKIVDGKITFDNPPVEYGMDKFKPLEMPAGALVVLHGENVHYSAPNSSPVSRHAYSMHFVEGADGYVWEPDNWAQRPPEQPFEPLYTKHHT